MGIARNLEERLERLVEGVSAAIFRGKVQPVDLGNRLVRFADLRTEVTWLGPTIPNVYRLFVAADDIADGDASELGLATLGDELAHVLRVAAADAGWATLGPISVTIEAATDGNTASTVQSASAPGTFRPWGQLIAIRGAAVHGLGDNRVGIGRGDDVEVRLDHAEVSRHHAVFHREAGDHWLSDPGSTNGTWLNQQRVGSEPALVRPGDLVRFGPLAFSFRTL